jgi:MFS family permease
MVTDRKVEVARSPSLKKKGIFYGWWIAVAAAVLSFFCAGSFIYGFSVFFNPIRNTFKWTAAETSAAFSFRSVENGIFSPIIGRLADKVAPRKLLITGVTIIGIGFILMSFISSLWTFYGCFMLIAGGESLAGLLVVNTTIANWFSKKRSRALTIIFIGPGLSGLLAPLMAFSINEIGWRQTLLFMGMAFWAITIPLSLLFRDRPKNYGYLPDGEPIGQKGNISNVITPGEGFTAREAIKSRTFWMLSLSQLLLQMALSAVLVHIVAYLENVGVPRSTAAVSVTGLTMCSLIGRLGFGFLGDFTNKRYLIAISFVLQAIGLFAFSMITLNNMWLLIVFLLTYGPGFGGPAPLYSALQADYFGTKHFGTIMGLLTTSSVIPALISPVIAGRIVDVMGNYKLAWQLAAFTVLPAIPLMLFALPPKKRLP